ncbi:MAG: hypothetical protein GTN81_07710, partial [Proteobacteria bacterium]|nr:hypothetical protein [Pseudomonadota bacterium]
MQFIVHIATTFQSFKALPRDIQELIFARVQQENRIKNRSHPILDVSLDDYLSRQVQEFATICHSLKHRMAVCPEFGHLIGIATMGIT